ncbi:hypothetical protein [Prochlorothrix hollandica]|uniref:hypothetical protein n=1 Tax=Prochlorothrix hollandica TaxID=1223 RepID=UPI0033423164
MGSVPCNPGAAALGEGCDGARIRPSEERVNPGADGKQRAIGKSVDPDERNLMNET